MAGIGFSLKKLFSKRGIGQLCRAYAYAGIICAGPMILGVILLVGIAWIARFGGMSGHDRELLNCMLTYSLLISLTFTSWFNMATTRYLSDMLYEEKPDKIMPSFYGSLSIILVFGAVVYGIFLHFSGVRFSYQVMCLWFSLVLMVVWMEMIYLTAVKDFKGIVTGFAVSLTAGFLLALIFVLIGWVTIESLMLAVIVAYGIMMTWFYKMLLDYFPRGKGSKYTFLRWFDRYRSLAFTGGFLNIGLFAHLVIMYFGPLAVQVEGLFYGAPTHDVPALCAYFSLLITTVNFVTSVEVRFYPRYRNYYSLFNDKGSIKDIRQAEDEMLTVLHQEMGAMSFKQLLCSLLFIVIGSIVLYSLPLGFTDLSMAIFRYLCIGYGLYAISNSLMLILLYFEDYTGALLGTFGFALVSVSATIWQILHSPTSYYGLGFSLGALVFFVIVWLRLEWFTKRLAHFLLSRSAAPPKSETGLFALLCNHLDARDQKAEEKEIEYWNRRAEKENKRYETQ
ncbi:MAG: exopolysaccharide Pel transporter PelG [Lachnospiraceae bacterium]|nr:exopolysaccharide Pel transporter PelG [Lachnospiraceae bacterium]